MGKLYWDYRGGELEKIRTERMEKILTTPSQEKIEYQAPMVKESLHVAGPAKETKLVEPKPVSVEEKVTQAPVPSETTAQDKKAKEENYPARSVYKLQEINKKYRKLNTLYITS